MQAERSPASIDEKPGLTARKLFDQCEAGGVEERDER
jgi:hypothetical protein